MSLKAKKVLGQHFLINESVAKRIANSLEGHGGYDKILEVGPGTGMLTKYLLEQPDKEIFVSEVDDRSVEVLTADFPLDENHLLHGDFLKLPLTELVGDRFAVIGNFPYHISSEILMRVFRLKDHIPEVVGMFQKEVADRIVEGKGKKSYGILSVLLQTYYSTEYLMTVDAKEFDPPPKVTSGVLRLQRNERTELPCDERLFERVVKASFNLRRKTLRNSLKSFGDCVPENYRSARPEQLDPEDFIQISCAIEAAGSDSSIQRT